MKANIINGNIRIVPFDENEPYIEITEEQKTKLENGLLKYENGTLIDNSSFWELHKLRAKRQPLLIAFDKYKTNVVYGVEIESEEQRNKIIKWYNAIKDLDENYIVKEENIPERIKYYL